jgi:hypothetical protein
MSDPLNPYPGNLRRHIVDNSDLQVLILRTNDMEGLEHVRDIYEAARAKDAELIQRLVDTLQHVADAGTWSPDISEAIAAADAHGFKPTEQ